MKVNIEEVSQYKKQRKRPYIVYMKKEALTKCDIGCAWYVCNYPVNKWSGKDSIIMHLKHFYTTFFDLFHVLSHFLTHFFISK